MVLKLVQRTVQFDWYWYRLLKCWYRDNQRAQNTHLPPSHPLSVQHERDALVYASVHIRFIFRGYCCVVHLFLITAWLPNYGPLPKKR